MDAKSELIQKIQERIRLAHVAASKRQTLIETFKVDHSELHERLCQLASEIPKVRFDTMPSEVDGELIDSLHLELFGEAIKFEPAAEKGRYGLKVSNLWMLPTFLVCIKMNDWQTTTSAGQRLSLTDDVILKQLSKFVDKPPAA
jgi:hypothetical protein